MLLQTLTPKPFSQLPLLALNPNPNPNANQSFPFVHSSSITTSLRRSKTLPPLSASSSHNPTSIPGSNPDPNPNPSDSISSTNQHKPRRTRRTGPKGKILKELEKKTGRDNPSPKPDEIPSIKPRKARRGRRSEAQAAEDFIRSRLEETFSSIRAKNPGLLEKKGKILKDKPLDTDEANNSDVERESNGEGEEEEGNKCVVEQEDPDWPLDGEIGWGIRASDYFEKHSIKNVVVDGVEIDWEREIDEGWVQEINCLEWESFAFHPSPLVVLVFERYNRAADNWKFLKEFEKAAKVYWNSKDKLPPRTVKIDINIETDLAYALKVKECDCPQLLFLRGNRILYREKEIRSADELVKMIAHFYYNAKKPDWVDSSMVA